MTKTTFQQEQKRVERVMNVIDNEMTKQKQATGELKSEIVNIRKHFWDEVKVNLDTFDDYLETIIGLRQETQALSARQSTHRQATKRLIALERMKHKPYFGRIDFQEDGTSSPEEVYIGVATLSDEAGDEFLVYDWRAPISSVYYDYEPGQASYKIPDGEIIEGTLDSKWQYIVREGELESMFDARVTIGDEVLQEVLGQGTDPHMHNIVATIQQEQNEAIRHDKGKLLIVHGAAGSGKTSVAMQRIAYLLYKYRDFMTSDQILLFSPNAMFSSYVSNVLPELGEENMQQATFQDYLRDRIGTSFQMESPFAQIEYSLTKQTSKHYETRLKSMEWKASKDFFGAMNDYIRLLGKEGIPFRDLRFRGQTLVSSGQIAKQFYSQNKDLRLPNRIEKLQQWLAKKLRGMIQNERQKPWVQNAMELLSDEAYYEARRLIAKKKGITGEGVEEFEVNEKSLSQFLVEQKMKPLMKQVRAYEFIDFPMLYRRMFSPSVWVRNLSNVDWPKEWGDVCRITTSVMKNGTLFYEDATPYVYLRESLLGFISNRTIKHVVVDEAQDYSPFQFEFLKRLFPSARMTVLGDFNQAIFPHAKDATGFEELVSLYGEDETTILHLARSYRSTKEIVEYSKSIVQSPYAIVPFDRSGREPVEIPVDSDEARHAGVVQTVREMKDRGYESIAVICHSAKESAEVYGKIGKEIGAHLMTSKSTEYNQGVVIIPSYLAKGIEFEAVVVYDASAYDDARLRRTFYTVCTRAMHELVVYQ